MVGMVVCPFATQDVPAQSLAVSVQPESPPRAVTVTVDVNRVLLKNALELIARQAGLIPVYGASVTGSVARVSVHVRNMPVAQAFEEVLGGTALTATIRAGSVVFTEADVVPARPLEGGLTGKVIDAKTKLPLRGATIALDGAGRGATTGDDGTFHFAAVTSGSHTVSVRLLAYVKATKITTIVDGQTASIEVALEPSVNALDQVVVTGTIVATAEKAIPNAITVITQKDIEQRGITRIDQLFRGDVPGLFSMNAGTSVQVYGPNQVTTMFSRGTTSLGGTANPIKTYVDGIELSNMQYLNQIDPKSIERIEILTGPQASTIYGSNALGGVMQIFTKRGTAARPQLTATFLEGLIENNFHPTLTPQHDYSSQVNGVEGRLSYNVGGSWVYQGAWTPSEQMTTSSGFGGARMQAGSITADASVRMGISADRNRGGAQETVAIRQGSGAYAPDRVSNNGGNSVGSVTTQTIGLSFGYTPFSWWSHQVTVGHDLSDSNKKGDPAFLYGDSSFSYRAEHSAKTSLSYNTTARLPVSSWAQATLTVGADQWNNEVIYTDALGIAGFSGSLSSVYAGWPTVQRMPSRNTGAFFQGQLGIVDALFFTYGLRAEWNPEYGDAVQPNYAPKYGVAYTQEFGPFTAKLRATYGRSTRPPAADQKLAISSITSSYYYTYYGAFDMQLPNADLGPEFQQGGEGGLDLFFGQRASLNITRYNQTVDGLITGVPRDSVPSLPYPFGTDYDEYYYAYQTQNLNIGSIRNQGWELTGTINTGPISTKGTYSYTKSRMIGITPKYRALFPADQYPNYQPGAVFTTGYASFPEHTWALQILYGRGNTSASLNFHGTGMLYRYWDDLVASYQIRLDSDRPVMEVRNYHPQGLGYVTTDLNASHRFASNVEGVFQVVNLTNYYQSDYSTIYPVIGRQSKIGLRLRY